MRKIKLDPEYNYYVLWDLVEADYLESLDLPISHQLAQRISHWQDVYNATLDLNDPYNSDFNSESDRQAFDQEGLEIAKQMQIELGQEYQIYYRDKVVQMKLQPFPKRLSTKWGRIPGEGLG